MSKTSTTATDVRATRVPYVRYLEITDDGATLVSEECDTCSARFFDARQACARCSGRTFHRVALPQSGRIGSFTIVHRAAPGVPTPYVSAVVYLDDSTAVKTNIIGCEPDPEHVKLGMAVRLTTYTAKTAADGTEAVAFAFVPAASNPNSEEGVA